MTPWHSSLPWHHDTLAYNYLDLFWSIWVTLEPSDKKICNFQRLFKPKSKKWNNSYGENNNSKFWHILSSIFFACWDEEKHVEKIKSTVFTKEQRVCFCLMNIATIATVTKVMHTLTQLATLALSNVARPDQHIVEQDTAPCSWLSNSPTSGRVCQHECES